MAITIDDIRRTRERHRAKQPLPEPVLTVVAGVVQKFGLTALPAERAGGELPAARTEERLSLFPLLSPAQWRLVRAIAAQYDNPYLAYARSPEDFGLSQRLYELNPRLEPETLQEHGLGRLWERDAKRRLQE